AMLGCASGCGGGGNNGDAGSAAPAVVMSVTGARVRVAPIRAEIRLLGTTVAQRHISLRAPTAGRVIGFNLRNGDRVRRGEVVGHVLSREVEAAENGLAVAQRIDPAEAASLARSVKPYTHSRGVPVTVPENAVVAQPLVSSGQMVADLDPLADLIDPRSVYVEASVPIGDLSMVKPGMSATVTSPLGPGVEYRARVAALSPSFSQSGASSPARIEFSGGERIVQAGAPVEVMVTTAYVAGALVIPPAALFQNAATNGYYVFVAGNGDRAQRTPITIGIRTAGKVQVTAGLQRGDIVITSGGYALSNGLKVSVAVAQN
ncbi:MAG: efflux RND transporter periplasmic adaptor subunit, partial [Candidatus Binataceae bacterium]